MEPLEQIRDRILAAVPGSSATLVPNPSPSAQHSLLLGSGQARAIATFLRDDPTLRLDYCSNVTGVDWPPPAAKSAAVGSSASAATPPVPTNAGSPPHPTAQTAVPTPAPAPTPATGGHLEVVYHLYSMALKHGPVIVRLRTVNRSDQVTLPSLTPVWRSCEFQEREVYDLYGVNFEGHPDLRRILMWDGFKDHPMRKDYVEPDDYEWEPTPHGEVAAKAAAATAAMPGAGGKGQETGAVPQTGGGR